MGMPGKIQIDPALVYGLHLIRKVKQKDGKMIGGSSLQQRRQKMFLVAGRAGYPYWLSMDFYGSSLSRKIVYAGACKERRMSDVLMPLSCHFHVPITGDNIGRCDSGKLRQNVFCQRHSFVSHNGIAGEDDQVRMLLANQLRQALLQAHLAVSMKIRKMDDAQRSVQLWAAQCYVGHLRPVRFHRIGIENAHTAHNDSKVKRNFQRAEERALWFAAAGFGPCKACRSQIDTEHHKHKQGDAQVLMH